MLPNNHILVVEDEPVIRSSLCRLLERHNYRVSEASSVQNAIETHNIDEFDMVISDLRLPGAPGTDLITAISAPVLIMTSYSSIRSAIDVMKLGATDYIAKPFDHKELLDTVEKILNDAFARKPEESSATQPIRGMIGKSDGMNALFARATKIASTSSTVLINGESGTGKELVARGIHELSARSQHEMISVNCAAIPENLIESELFGHEKGAFTGAVNSRTGLVEAADNSSLFLDEIGELPLEAQARLLRVLQDNEIRKIGSIHSKKVDVRLLVATHRDLKKLVNLGEFREDLFYRINVMTITIPPLRERGSDILDLATDKLKKACDRLNKRAMTFTKEAKIAIQNYGWPGNVRELENSIERAVVLTESSEIREEFLALDNKKIEDAFETPDNTEEPTTKNVEEMSLSDYFQRFVKENEATMNETQLAKKLGISRKCLWERRQRLGIPKRKNKKA
ncbi:MAG: response regulator [Deltaproteobacteria bacterium]|jgi:DNA-binding NtrC family response regulator|nr:response regulator [Deltaproteobacteria bacterium]